MVWTDGIVYIFREITYVDEYEYFGSGNAGLHRYISVWWSRRRWSELLNFNISDELIPFLFSYFSNLLNALI